jgi:hypothetical protein
MERALVGKIEHPKTVAVPQQPGERAEGEGKGKERSEIGEGHNVI